MTTTPYEDAVADAVTEAESALADSWPIVVSLAIGFLGFKIFKRVTR